MRKLYQFNHMFLKLFLIAIIGNFQIVTGQKVKEKPIPIPDTISVIFQKSCMPCHWDKGGRFPKSRLNFSRWEGYGPAKESEKALLICSTLRKGKMPPKSVRESHPELNPTKDKVELICKWAESSRPQKK